MRHGKAEAIQDHINRDENMSLSLQNSPRRCVVAGSSAHQPRQSKRSQVSESSPRDARDCLLRRRQSSRQSLRHGERTFATTIVNRETEPVTRRL